MILAIDGDNDDAGSGDRMLPPGGGGHSGSDGPHIDSSVADSDCDSVGGCGGGSTPFQSPSRKPLLPKKRFQTPGRAIQVIKNTSSSRGKKRAGQILKIR